MAKQTTFKVSKKGHEGVQISFNMPESIDDPRWQEITTKGKEDVNELACQNLVVKLQAVARARIDEGVEAMQEAVDGYIYGTRSASSTVVRRPTLQKDAIKSLKFTPEQLAALKAAGMNVATE